MNVAAKGIPNADGIGNEFSITYGALVGNDVNFLLSLSQQNKTKSLQKILIMLSVHSQQVIKVGGQHLVTLQHLLELVEDL